MRRKIILLVVGVSLLGGVLLVQYTDNLNIPPSPVSLPTPSDEVDSMTSYDRVVVASDESVASAPRQDIYQEPTMPKRNSFARSPAKNSDNYVTINNKQYPLRVYRTMATPNDPYANQWWVANTKLDKAWDTPRGNNPTLLAIIDTGFALRHEEFADRWHVNPGESGSANTENPSRLNCRDRGLALNANCNLIDDNRDGIVDNESGSTLYQNHSRLNCTAQGRSLAKYCNLVDDDENGYVDDVTGWDFMNFDNSVQAGELNPSGSGTTHGTLVAGVAAASGNNSKGIAGVDWGTKILPVQALDDDSYGDTLSVGQAIFYAVQQGADVISLSLGSDYPDDYVREAVHAAAAAGSVAVAASGNDGCDCMVYPAKYPEVVAVGALQNMNAPASFSSWGADLDILAPGTNITTSTWSAANPTRAYASGANGTSFATPLVGGMLTRLLSHRPEATPQQLTAALTESTNRLSLASRVSHSPSLGHGALDTHKSTLRMVNSRHSSHLYAFTPVYKGEYFNPVAPVDKGGTYAVHECESGTVGATPIFELTNKTSQFYSSSRVEAAVAQQVGYKSKFLAYACVQQPHDTAHMVRNIDIFREFRNVYRLLE